jgi:hypothetical protein
MAESLSRASTALIEDRLRMEKENARLVAKLAEYDQMLALVGDDGGYNQLVEDWCRVLREKEECRKDLRRFGWTGD